MEFTTTRKLQPEGEKRDCTVHALMNAISVSYNTAHTIAALAGRKNRQGFHTSELVSYCVLKGIFTHRMKKLSTEVKRNKWGVLEDVRPTLSQALGKIRTGRYILVSKGHAFAVVDGRIFDVLSRPMMRCRIKYCYEITLPAARESQPQPKAELAQSDIAAMWERLNRIEEKLC